MSHRMTLRALALIGVSALATAAFAQAPAAPGAPAAPAAGGAAAPAAPAPENSKVQTFAKFASAAGTENICGTADGSLYVTLIDDKKVMKVGPDGKVSEFASLPTMAHVLAVACGADSNEVGVVAYGKSFRKPNPSGQGNILAFDDTETHVVVYDVAGKQLADIAAPKGVGLNGFDQVGGGIYYAGDSASGGVYKVDTKAKTVTLWYKNDAWGPSQAITIGVNGVRYSNGWVYVASAAKLGLYKIQVGANGMPQGAPVTLQEGVRPDDFDVAPNGDVYFPSGTALYKVAASGGGAVKFVEPIQGGPSAFVSNDGKWVYWPTRGGTAPQRVVRVAL